MKSAVMIHQVNGHQFKVWSDYITRATYAEDEAGTVKILHWGGYISKDLTIRKTIAAAFHLPTFRK